MLSWKNTSIHLLHSFVKRNCINVVAILLIGYLSVPILLPLVSPGYPADLSNIGHIVAIGESPDNYSLVGGNGVYFSVTRFSTTGIMSLASILSFHNIAFSSTLFKVFTFIVSTLAGVLVLRRVFSLELAEIILVSILGCGFYFSFYYVNDSISAIAFMLSGLAFLTINRSWTLPMAAAAGLCFGLSVLCRPDALVLAAAVAPILYMTSDTRHTFYLRAGLVTGAALLTSAVAVFMFGYDPSEGLRLTLAHKEEFDQLGKLNRVGAAISRLGPPALFVAIALGTWRLATERKFLLLWIGVGAPLVLALFYGPSLWQARYLLPVLPLLLGVAAIGLRWSADLVAQGRIGKISATVLATALLGLGFAPPIGNQSSEGPHPIVGHYWSPILWVAWWHALEGSKREVDAAIGGRGAAAAGILVAEGGGVDSWVAYRLLANGYRPEVRNEICTGLHTHFVRGSRAVDLVTQEANRPDSGQAGQCGNVAAARLSGRAVCNRETARPLFGKVDFMWGHFVIPRRCPGAQALDGDI